MVSGFVARTKGSDSPDDGLSSVGDDALVLVVLSFQRTLVGQHDVIVDESSVEKPNIVRSSSRYCVLAHALPGRAGSFGRDVMIVNETFSAGAV